MDITSEAILDVPNSICKFQNPFFAITRPTKWLLNFFQHKTSHNGIKFQYLLACTSCSSVHSGASIQYLSAPFIKAAALSAEPIEKNPSSRSARIRHHKVIALDVASHPHFLTLPGDQLCLLSLFPGFFLISSMKRKNLTLPDAITSGHTFKYGGGVLGHFSRHTPHSLMSPSRRESSSCVLGERCLVVGGGAAGLCNTVEQSSRFATNIPAVASAPARCGWKIFLRYSRGAGEEF